MALSESAKNSFAFKKLLGRDYTFSGEQRRWYNEDPGGGFNVSYISVWSEDVPATAPGASTSVVKCWTDAADGAVKLTEDTGVPNERAWYADSGGRLKNWIPPKYDTAEPSSYEIALYEDDGTGLAKGTKIPTSDAQGIEWLFDYEAGVIAIQNTHTYTTPFWIEGYQYIGDMLDTTIGALGGGGATVALDNLDTVAINTSLVSDTDSTDDLGTDTVRWKDIYADSIYIGSGSTTMKFSGTASGTINITGYLVPSADLSTQLGNINLRFSSVHTRGVIYHNDTWIYSSASGTINISGNLMPSASNSVYGLGDASYKFSFLYVKTAFITNLTVTNSLTVCGSTTLGGSTLINNTLNVSSATTIDGATKINNTLDVTGAATFGGTMVVSGVLTVNDQITLNDSLVVSADAVIGGNFITCGFVTMNNAVVEISGTFTTYGGPVVISASQIVLDGSAILKSTLTVSGKVTMNDNLSVTGAQSIGNLATIATTAPLNIYHGHVTTGSKFGLQCIVDSTPSVADTTGNFVGIGGYARMRNSNVQHPVYGLQFGPYAISTNGGHTDTTCYGIQTWAARSLGVTFTCGTGYGLHISPYTRDTGGAVSATTLHGLYVANASGFGGGSVATIYHAFLEEPTRATDNYQLVLAGTDTASCGMWVGGPSGEHIGSDGTDLYTSGNVNVGGELKGSRQCLCFGRNFASSNGFNALQTVGSINSTASIGYRTIRKGSIVGVSHQGVIDSHSVNGNFSVWAQLQGTSTVTSAVLVTGNGNWGAEATVSRGTWPFDEGEVISAIVGEFGTYNYSDVAVMVEIVYDS